MTLYANVRKSSRYGSQRQEEPFPVSIHSRPHYLIDGFFWQGGVGGQYRTVDLEFYCKDEQTEKFIQVSPLNGGEPDLINQLTVLALTASCIGYMENFVSQLELALVSSKEHLDKLISDEKSLDFEEDD